MTRAELPEQIETERLVLRFRTVADAEVIFDYASRPEVSYPAGFPPVKTLEDEIYTQLFSKSNLVHCLLTVDFKTFFSSPRITS